jgi:hypothetical protein
MSLTKLEAPAAVAVVGLAGFQLWDAWNKNAPTLSECRSVDPAGDPAGHIAVKQRWLDANLTVGSLAVIIGTVFWVLAGDFRVLLIMVLIFATLSLWHHSVIDADSR